jgi:hypothetical protein
MPCEIFPQISFLFTAFHILSSYSELLEKMAEI